MDRGKRSAVRCLDDRTVGVRLRWMPPSFLPGPRNGLSERIGRAPHAASAGAVENVRVDHGRLDVRVTQELLDRPNIIAIFDQVGRERVPKCMTACGFLDSGVTHGLLDGSLNGRLVQMVAPLDTCSGVVAARLRGENPVPRPFALG